MIDVLIVGAGPTGLTLAILCNRLGLSYRIIDKNSAPVKESRALGIQARTLEIFHKLGIVDEFLKRGMKAEGAKIFINGKKRLEIDLHDMERYDTLYPYIFFLPQRDTEIILSKEIPYIERNTDLVSFEDHVSFVEAQILRPDGGTEFFSARYVCGCDGSHSVVRKKLGLRFQGGAYAADFLMADCKVNWKEDHSTLKVFMRNGKVSVFFPIFHSKRSRVLTIADPEKKNVPQTIETTSFPATLSELEEEFRIVTGLDVHLSDPDWVTRYRVHHRSVNQMRRGNVFVLGDAAHIHSPVGAQGMNTGIQDANNLAWKLKLAIDKPHLANEILDTYTKERLPIAKHLINLTDRIFSLVVTKNNFLLGVRNSLLPIVTKGLMSFPGGKRTIVKFVSQLNIHYHPNAVVMLKAGERFPNLNNIHDLLKGYEFHAVVFSKNKLSQDEKKRVEEKLRINNIHFLHHDSEQVLYLIRPDGYIGMTTNDLDNIPDFNTFDIKQIQSGISYLI